MKIDEIDENSMKIDEKSMKIDENQWKSMEINAPGKV